MPNALQQRDAEVAVASSELQAEVRGREVSYRVLPDAGSLYVRTCTNAVRLEKIRGTERLSLEDARPIATNGPFFLDGHMRPFVYAGEGCDVLDCTLLRDDTLSRVEIVPSPPLSAQPEGAADGLPVLSSRLAALPLELVVDAFRDEGCTGPATRMVATVTAGEAPVPRPTRIRFHNRSPGAVAFITDCGSRIAVSVYTDGSASTYAPRCHVERCDTLGSGAALSEETGPCSQLPCAGTPSRLPVGATSEPVEYDGDLMAYDDRLCVEQLPVSEGTPMLVHVCWGSPTSDPFALEGIRCRKLPFSYGTPEVVLDVD